MAEDMMNEEMTGMAAPAPAEAPMPEEPMPMEEKEPSIDMETLMGNFMDLADEDRKIATRLLASPATVVLDKIIGEPVLARLVEQLGTPMDTNTPEPEAAEGMMAPSTEPMADMPAEEEEATPPV
jgi:hypothetical protein